MSRVDACRLAAAKPVLPVVNCGAASDAFFPFRDGLDILADAGVTAVVAPAGSIRDQEIIAAADERQMAFLQTPKRHFRH
jgi:phosphoribosylaminoimidazolecarboxamide formyltransferase/IMP cyclohydrolase